MTADVAESLAKLRLIHGDSADQQRELASSQGQLTLTVGSGPSSSWVVRAEGVRPLHFSLHWDGETLRIADTYGAGDVRADGQAVTAQWRSLHGVARIEFGRAQIEAEVSQSQPQASPATLLELPVEAVLGELARSEPSGAADATVRIPTPLPDAPEPEELPPAEFGGAAALDATVALPTEEPVLLHEPSAPAVEPLAEVAAEPEAPEPEAPEPKAPEPVAAVIEEPPAQPAVVVAQTSAVTAEATPSTRPQKSTLIGVSPIVLPGESPSSVPPRPSVEPAASEGSSAVATQLAFTVPPRPGSERPRKPTLLGMAVTIPPPAEADVTVPIAYAAKPAEVVVSKPVEKVIGKEVAPRPTKGEMSGTLIGVSNPVEFLRAAQEYKETQAANRVGQRSDPPGGIATHQEMRAIAPLAAPPPGEDRIGSTWQETPSSAPHVPPAVLLNSSFQHSAVDPSMHPSLDAYDRYGDAPGPRGAAYDPRTARRTFPWRYVGIGALTAAAYFAWLYLLDHL